MEAKVKDDKLEINGVRIIMDNAVYIKEEAEEIPCQPSLLHLLEMHDPDGNNKKLPPESDDKSHTCSICNKSFTRARNLAGHMKAHSGKVPVVAKTFTCTLCHKTFTRSRSLASHIRTHTGEKPYVCSHCDRAFAESGALIRHARTHTGERPYICQICNKPFAQVYHLTRHQGMHAREKLAAPHRSSDGAFDRSAEEFPNVQLEHFFSLQEVKKECSDEEEENSEEEIISDPLEESNSMIGDQKEALGSERSEDSTRESVGDQSGDVRGASRDDNRPASLRREKVGELHENGREIAGDDDATDPLEARKLT